MCKHNKINAFYLTKNATKPLQHNSFVTRKCHHYTIGMRLTDRAIKNLKPAAKDLFVSDGDGLYIRIRTSGTKTFLIRNSRLGGKTKWTTLGEYPAVTLLEARRKLEAINSVEFTVEEVYNEFDSHTLAKYARPDIPRASFRNDVLPKIGGMDISDVKRTDIFTVIQPILDRGSPKAANRALSNIKHLFQYALERGYIDDDPTVRITRKSCGGKEVSRDRVLSFDELESFLKYLHNDFKGPRGLGVTTIAALYLCVLTGQRSSEVLWIMRNWKPGMKIIFVPPDDNKSKRLHTVHLSLQARAVLKLIEGLPVPRSHTTVSRALNRHNFTFTPHDLRRTLATRLSDLDVEPYVIEKILNHKMTGVMAVYNHAEYLPHRKAALDLWGRKVASLRRSKT